ncbi:hypothetical protein HY971_02000 [Candidatus Kaiserbacteria bacterium]|nr:hypothetical protein [Candidatus Kaiserbacteria bacterium]
MVRNFHKIFFFGIVLVASVALAALLYFEKFISRFYSGERAVVAGASCVEPTYQQANSGNPNKTLFVTCDGYLE